MKTMKKILISWLLRDLVADLSNPGDIDEEERTEGYLLLADNRFMMRNFDKMLVEDTKKMMTEDALRPDLQRGIRIGLFMRTKAIRDTADRIKKETVRQNAAERPAKEGEEV